MGLFDKFKKKGIEIGAPVSGECVPLAQVSDPTFGEEILGKGIAIKPDSGRVVAPASGTISTIFPTGHAVAITTPEGAEILVHFGLDTVSLKGEHFTTHVKEGKQVEKGELLIEVDVDKVKAAGFDVITPMVICNSDEFASIEGITGKTVTEGEHVLTLVK